MSPSRRRPQRLGYRSGYYGAERLAPRIAPQISAAATIPGAFAERSDILCATGNEPLQSTFSGGSPERWTVSCCGVCPAWIPTGLALAVIEEVRFAIDSPLEGEGFEPSVPRDRDDGFRSHYAAPILGPPSLRCARARATRPTPPSGSPERPIVRGDELGERFARHAWGAFMDKAGARDRLRRFRASGGVPVRLLGNVRDL